MNKLNVFKYGYDSCGRTIFKKSQQFFRNIKYAYQRCVKGYCDLDLWNLDYFYSELFYQSLNELADTSHSYPGRGMFSDEQAQAEGYESGYDRWCKYLKEVGRHFANTQEDRDDVPCNQKSAELYEMYTNTNAEANRLAWLAQEKNCYKYREEEKDKAMIMLKDIFFDLWD